jgi:hypothetical protein
MKCPLCDTEMRILSTEYVQNEGQIFTKQTFTCRKKDCKNNGKEVKIVYIPLGNIVEDSEAGGTEQ